MLKFKFLFSQIISKCKTQKELSQKLKQIISNNIFDVACKKNVDQLCAEIIFNNQKENVETDAKTKIRSDFEEVLKCYEKPSTILKSNTLICKLSKKEILEWATSFKIERKKSVEDILVKVIVDVVTGPDITSKKEPPSIHEQIAVIMRAIKIFRNYEPRDIQILSLLILLNPEDGKGRLAQINTGEGKTTIIAMLSVLKVLAGHSVDVITSSPELAKPQAEELEDFYAMFGLTVSHNGNDEVEKSTRYKSDIVYGTAAEFQGDILRDEFSKLGTRGGRECDFGIVDEVDSMLIDGRDHIVMLSSEMPAMNYLEPFYAAIWIQVGIFANAIIKENGKFYLKERMSIDGDEEEATPIEGSKEDFIRIHIYEKLKEEIEKGEESELKIPNHLREMILETQLEKWIDSAINAKYHFKLNQHYILEKGKVVPVDSDNTGVLQQNTNWNNGLHQFIQLKHGVCNKNPNLTSHFYLNLLF